MTKTIQLLTDRTAVHGAAPTSVTDGVSMEGVTPENAVVNVWNTAGTGTMTAGLRIWGYFYAIERWLPVPIGLGSTVTIGRLFDSTGTVEVLNDLLVYSEEIRCLNACSRLFCEMVSITGTGTAISVSVTLFGKRG